MVAIAEAAAVAGAAELDTAAADELGKAWDLVAATANITRHELAKRIAAEAKLEVADLLTADPHAVKLVPAEVARRRTVVPLRCSDRELVVATSNPLSQDAKREIEAIASRVVQFEIGAPIDIELATLKAYGAPAQGDAAPIPPPDRVKPGGPHVLVVDDEAGARALFRSVLEEGGFRVTLAVDGADAIKILSEVEDFDLITLDYFMDRMNGLRVLQHIRAQRETVGLPVIMLTGADDRRIEMSLFEAGADDFIVKPIDAPLFLLRVHAALRRRFLH